MIFILSVFLACPPPSRSLPSLLPGAAPGPPLMDGPRQRPPGGGGGRRGGFRRGPTRPDPTPAGGSDLPVAPISALRPCWKPLVGRIPAKRVRARGEGGRGKPGGTWDTRQCRARMGMERVKGLGGQRCPWGRASLCHRLEKGARAAPGGPPAPQESRLVFQSRRAGIFSVQQISLMAQWRSASTLGALALVAAGGWGFLRGHGAQRLGRSPAEAKGHQEPARR